MPALLPEIGLMVTPPGDDADDQPSLPMRRIGSPLTPVASRATALPLAGRDRAAWRATVLVLILQGCHGRSATVEQLHLLMWAMRDESNGEVLLRAWRGDTGAPRVLRAFDPLLDDTLAVTRAAGLIEQRNTRQKLTEAGETLALKIRQTDGLMESEQEVLKKLGTISESQMWQRLGAPSRTSTTDRGRRG